MILFDFQTFLNQKYGGISRLFVEVMDYLSKHDSEFELPLVSSENVNLIGKDFYKPIFKIKYALEVPEIETWLSGKSFSGKTFLYSLYKSFKKLQNKLVIRFLNRRNQKLITKKLLDQKFKVFHPTYFDNYYLDQISKGPNKFVITIFDLIHERFPGYYKLDDIALRNRKSLCYAADRIIAISKSTKNDLMEFYGIPNDKIEVIHLASNLHLAFDLESNLIWKNYILFVGERGGYKNFNNFVHGVSPIIQKYKVNLIFAGGGKFTHEEKETLKKANVLGKSLQIPFQSDSEIKQLYQNALVFVFPSMYEGFGIPLLESMSLGCPVACSNTSSFPEVVGDAAVTFDPWYPESIRDSVDRLFNSESLRLKMIARGKERSKQFSWEKTGEKHLKIYNQLLASSFESK
ncbi:Glycosyltransferase [Leptospira biflexa serovar Patoc strain 'Patoc 1 (Ames)']|uniref:Putative glycosyltransferase n=1 Tax=Leptospira biflexa serovar Patoc (strain Patoc 1 / ATCC 23582 / Paris) TaxID=456481 RepID=B0SSM2_LEPBP|nr:glycosyltransferase family 1 protein [Leptospira biflexa]ABZ94457.1 Glycosyltransferase [Leptospira biflexa serovar Patoc strain 'Patoc 1 (Ames)']ABZ98112.1 Putative glycosyltransferase [Leptospira biflexa serovar Patoc strain 'Patoc 1 (Paris)']